VNEDQLLANLAALKQSFDARPRIERVFIGPDGKPTGLVIRRFPPPPIVVNTANGRNAPSSAPSEDDGDQRG
jgi:hypothetical protein